MTFAVIETGGKQYKVSPNQKIKIEKIDNNEGDDVTFDRVLMVSDGDDVQIGSPYVDGAAVAARVLRQDKEKKKIVFKYMNKTRRGAKKGHRQPFTEVEIVGINK